MQYVNEYFRSPTTHKLSGILEDEKVSLILGMEDGTEIKLEGDLLKEFVWLIRCHRSKDLVPLYLKRMREMRDRLKDTFVCSSSDKKNIELEGQGNGKGQQLLAQ